MKRLKGHVQSAQTRLPGGYPIFAIALDRDSIGNMLDDPHSYAVMEIPDLLGLGPTTVLLMAAQPETGEFEPRLRMLPGEIITGQVIPATFEKQWESPGPPRKP